MPTSFDPPSGPSGFPAVASAAERMTGMVLDGDWVVGQRLDPPGGTGGCYSVRYEVRSARGDGAFLKALDISAILNDSTGDVAEALQKLTRNYLFERSLVEKCGDMSRVVHGLASGEAVVPGAALARVPYLIFELADGGDVRRHLATALPSTVGVAWKLRTLHHIAVGLQQLHRRGIAHQDLKPSNVLVFPSVRKVGDLGNASERGNPGPHDDKPIPGDVNYPPIELYYGFTDSEWETRLGFDLYLLGSMVVFFFTQATTNALIVGYLDPAFYPQEWTGTYDEVLPYLRAAFNDAVVTFKDHVPSPRLAEELSAIVGELCNPDPRRRGNPRALGHVPRTSLETYVSRFNHLAREAELSARQEKS